MRGDGSKQGRADGGGVWPMQQTLVSSSSTPGTLLGMVIFLLEDREDLSEEESPVTTWK